MCSLCIYTSQYLKENFTVRSIIFSLRTDIGKQTITFFATNDYNPIFHYKYKRYYNNLQLFLLTKKKKKDKLRLGKPTSLSVLE